MPFGVSATTIKSKVPAVNPDAKVIVPVVEPMVTYWDTSFVPASFMFNCLILY